MWKEYQWSALFDKLGVGLYHLFTETICQIRRWRHMEMKYTDSSTGRCAGIEGCHPMRVQEGHKVADVRSPNRYWR